MKKLGICTLLFALMACTAAFAGDEVEYDSKNKAWENSQLFNIAASNSSGAELTRVYFFYYHEHNNCMPLFFLSGNSKSPWVKNLENRINDDESLKNQTFRIKFSNGTEVSTSNSFIMRNKMLHALTESVTDSELKMLGQIRVGTRSDNCTESGYSGRMDNSRLTALLRTYDITSITVNGYTSNYSGSGTAAIIDRMLNEIEQKAGKSTGIGQKILPKSVDFKKIAVDYDVYNGGRKGMNIKLTFTTHGLKGVDCQLSGYFYFNTGTALKDYNNSYHTSDGNVSVGSDIKPGWDHADYNEWVVFMPYDELHLNKTKGTRHNLYFYFQLWDRSEKRFVGNNAQSEKWYFNITY